MHNQYGGINRNANQNPTRSELVHSISDDWHTLHAENDLQESGRFTYRMETRDGCMGFDLGGVYNIVAENEEIQYTLGDGRKVAIIFSPKGEITEITESFDPDKVHPLELQRNGWQAIPSNFKKYTESLN